MTPSVALRLCRDMGRAPFVIVTKEGFPIAHIPRPAKDGLSLIKAAGLLRVEEA